MTAASQEEDNGSVCHLVKCGKKINCKKIMDVEALFSDKIFI